MVKILITHAAGDYARGDIVEVTERRARTLITAGYADPCDGPTEPVREAAMQQHTRGQRGRGGQGREAR